MIVFVLVFVFVVVVALLLLLFDEYCRFVDVHVVHVIEACCGDELIMRIGIIRRGSRSAREKEEEEGRRTNAGESTNNHSCRGVWRGEAKIQRRARICTTTVCPCPSLCV